MSVYESGYMYNTYAYLVHVIVKQLINTVYQIRWIYIK